jgi:two-component system cell cycle sensor histidine kinase/response regulator CckA
VSHVSRTSYVRRPARVLLVDDDRAQLKLCQLRLQDEGFIVETATSAESALESALRAAPDAIVSDVLMGELDGFGLCRKVREAAQLAHVPVVLLSAHYGDADARKLAQGVGAFGLTARTPTFDDELALLRAALANSCRLPTPATDAVSDTVLYEQHLRTNANQLTRLLGKAKHAEERYRTLFENANDAIAVLSHDGRVLEANERLHELLGTAPSELVGRNIREFAPAGQEDANVERFRRSIATGAGRNEAVPVQRRDGSVIYMEFSNTVIEIDGQLLVFSIGHDVTDSRAATQALMSAEARYRSLVERMPDVMWTAVDGKDLSFITPNIEAVSGYAVDELLEGGLTLWTSRVHADDREHVVAAMHTSGARPFDVEHRWQRKDGRWIWLRSRAIATYEREGALCLDGMFSDVTEKKQLEEGLRHAQKMEAIGQLTGGIAHDFNNILAAILANSHFLLDELAESDPRRADAEEIKVAAERAAALTKQLLAFSRRQMLEPSIVDLNATVAGLETMLRRLIGEHIEFDIVPGAELGSVRIDAGQLEQVVMNLVVNARDAMPGGGRLTIETANVELSDLCAGAQGPTEQCQYVMLSVRDTGCGMDAETKRRIFEPFFTTKPPGKGTGLGLSTCYGIVKQSGGSIWAYSDLGRGSVFKICLPRVAGCPESGKKRAPRAEVPGNETILLVEDDERVRTAVQRMLETRGYRVLAASNGAHAIELARSQRGQIQLVLSDVVMPGASGPEVVEQLQREGALRSLYMSGYSDHAVLKGGASRSEVHLIQKPFSPEALVKKIREVIDA